MRIKYGIANNNIDVTDICLTTLTNNHIVTIPSSDVSRAHHFTDPIIGTLKKIFILKDDHLTEYDYFYIIKINLRSNTIVSIINNSIINVNETYNIVNNIPLTDDQVKCKIDYIHSNLSITHGSLDDELPEQRMAVKYLTGNEKVLEIGANIGRNTLVIASILTDNSNLVTLESNTSIANVLIENRNLNNFNFYVEASALSKRKLIQSNWDSKPSDTLEEGWSWANIISISELKAKYNNIVFDTLVLDCEGAFYYILMDMPEILDNINLIIMENDYWDISKKQYIDDILIKNSFHRDYVESGGWGVCSDFFYEVWKK